jgi:hypothetical protein
MGEVVSLILFAAIVTIAIALWRIGNALQKGFNEHVKAMQAIYEKLDNRK